MYSAPFLENALWGESMVSAEAEGVGEGGAGMREEGGARRGEKHRGGRGGARTGRGGAGRGVGRGRGGEGPGRGFLESPAHLKTHQSFAHVCQLVKADFSQNTFRSLCLSEPVAFSQTNPLLKAALNDSAPETRDWDNDVTSDSASILHSEPFGKGGWWGTSSASRDLT